MDLVQERGADGTVKASYVRDGNIGGILSRSTPDGTFYYHYDGGGNVVALTDANENIVAQYSYDAFGNTLSASGAQAEKNPFRFSSKYYDGDTGLYDYGLRHYDSSLGRWINRDPIAEAGGLNLYGMVANNPTNNVDPYGLTWGEGYDSVYGHRADIWKVAAAYKVPAVLLAAVVYIEVGSSGRKTPGRFAANQAVSLAFFVAGRMASLGITQVQLDPNNIPECKNGSAADRDKWASDYLANDLEQLRAGARKLKSIIALRPYPQTGLTDHDMSIILTHYNGVKRAVRPYKQAKPNAYGRNFLNQRSGIGNALSGVERETAGWFPSLP